AMTVSPDGSTVFVTGESLGRGGIRTNYATVAYDASTGAEGWARRYSAGSYYAAAYALAVSPDGSRLVVTGERDNTSHSSYLTIAYTAATAAQDWVRSYWGPTQDAGAGHAVAMSRDGALVFVTGGHYGRSTSDYATIAYDAASGKQTWARSYDGPGHDQDIAYALGTSPEGSSLFVT